MQLSQNGHQEVANTSLRPTRPPALSRPFPPGFTPVFVNVSPGVQHSIKQSDSSPVFLPPALRSPLPPSDDSLRIEKQRTTSNRLVKTPPSPQPPQRNQAKLFPTIRRICNASRPSQRSPSHSVSEKSSPSPAPARSHRSTPSNGPTRPMPTTNRLRSSSNSASNRSSPSPAHGRSDRSTPTNDPTQPIFTTNRLRSLSQHSSTKSTPRLWDLKPSSFSECSLENSDEISRNKATLSQVKSRMKPGIPRIRSISTSLSGSTIERATHSLLPRRPKEHTQNHSKCKPDLSCTPTSTREPPLACTGKAQVDYAPSYLRLDSDGIYQTETPGEIELLKKLPDYTLDNWTGWRREILISACPSPEPSISRSASCPSPELSTPHSAS